MLGAAACDNQANMTDAREQRAVRYVPDPESSRPQTETDCPDGSCPQTETDCPDGSCPERKERENSEKDPLRRHAPKARPRLYPPHGDYPPAHRVPEHPTPLPLPEPTQSPED